MDSLLRVAAATPLPGSGAIAICLAVAAEESPMTVQRLAGVFDHTGKIRRPASSLVLREAWSFLSAGPSPPDPAGLEHGRGHVVLLVPALLTTDAVTRPLRRFLGACGYRSFGWGVGVNWGPTPRLVSNLQRRLRGLREIEGGPVSVVGLSLGGLFARDLAHCCPHDVRHVVTIVSPFRLPTATVLEPLIRLCALCYPPAIDVARLGRPLPVPSTAIYTRQDGVVAWESCRSDDDLNCVAIEVGGSHIAACRNPDVFRAVARRLGECAAR
jgi:hypothetical protein